MISHCAVICNKTINWKKYGLFFSGDQLCRELKLPFHERNQFHHRAFFFFFYKSLTAQFSYSHPFRAKERPPIPISIPRLPSSLPLLLTMRFPFLQNYKVLKRTARTKALWKVVLLEVKRHCRCPSIHTVLMLWFVFFPLQWIMGSFTQWLRQDDQGESRVKVPPKELR